MILENFEVNIVGSNYEDSNGYCYINHGQQYSIRINNPSGVRIAAEISVDGKSVGMFRINAYNSLELQRPTNDTGRFTFFKKGSKEFNLANIGDTTNSVLGLISVLFKPEKVKTIAEMIRESYKPPNWQDLWYNQFLTRYANNYYDYDPLMIGSSNIVSSAVETETETKTCCNNLIASKYKSKATAGGTALTGESNQKFKTVENLDYDTEKFVRVNLRLVCDEREHNNGLRPLKSTKIKENKVPLPI